MTTIINEVDQNPDLNQVARNGNFSREQKIYRFQFHGQAREYFGIWIVNIALMILTLTLYAPWAKVRRLRYFYRNTELLAQRFDFTGLPRKIFIGRLVALSAYVLFTFIANYSVEYTFIGVLLLYLAVPWLIRSTLRFKARNSKFGNSRFYFSGTNKQAYWVFFLCILINLVTLGLFFPVLIWLYKRYGFEHLYVGQFKFEFKATWSSFMTAIYVPIFLFLGFLLCAGILSFILGLSLKNVQYVSLFVGITYIFALFLIWPLMSARLFIATWNNLSVSRSYFSTDANQWRYAWIIISNWFARICSLGLLTAWGAIRLYRYQVESLSLHLHNDPDALVNQLQNDPNAIAEEIADFFDFDISL